MRIALELQPCLRNRSGIGIYTYEIARELEKFSSLTLEGRMFNFMGRNNLSESLEGLSQKQKQCRLFPYGVYRRLWKAVPLPYSWIFGKDVDVSHFFSFVVPPGAPGKIVNTIHDVVWLKYPETMSSSNRKYVEDNIQRSIAVADRIVAVSQSTKKDIISLLGYPEEKITIASPGVNFEFFNACARQDTGCDSTEKETNAYANSESINMRNLSAFKAVKERYALPDKYILYVGTLEPRKNIERIVEAFSLLQSKGSAKDFKLVLAGAKGWLFESIFERVEKLGIKDKVIFTGYVDENDKPYIYHGADVFVFPSLYEGFGMPVLEAMSAGVPVVTSNVASLPEAAGDAAIMVEPLDSEAISATILRLIEDQELRKTCIEKGFAHARKFTWEKSAATLEHMYLTM